MKFIKKIKILMTAFYILTQNLKLNDQDRSMIYNIVLNSIRNNLFIKKY